MAAAVVRDLPDGAETGGRRVRRDSATNGRRPAPSDPQLSEATLVRLWEGQRLPASAVATRQGVPLLVLHPGRRGRGAGPDFRGASITTASGALLRGDVELHVRASDFRAHGHHRDPRYDGVVLHIVFEDDRDEDTRLASGRRVPVVALAPWVRRRTGELAAWLAGPDRWREPCHDAAARLGREELLPMLEALGDRRFLEREAALAEALRVHGPAEGFYRALLAGLGYGGDRRLPEEVAELLPWRELARLTGREEDRAVLTEALLLGTAGLLPSQQGRVLADPYERELEERWRPCGRPQIGRSEPAPPSLRPANHPARRLAGLAQLLMRHRLLLERGTPVDEFGGPAARLITSWTAPANEYWRGRAAPGVAVRRPLGALIGRGRAIELLTNAVLPWAAAAAAARGDPETAAQVRAGFARLPRPGAYGALAFLERRLQPGGTRLPLNARRQQGLLALYKTECTQGGCGRCPLS